MKTPLRLMVLSLFLGGTVMLAGCGEAKKKEKPAAPSAPDATDKAPAAPAAPADNADNADKAADPADATKAGDGAAKQAPAEQATASYSPKMSDDGETQMVALKLPNMT